MNKCTYISKRYLRGTKVSLAGNYWLSLLGIIIGVASLLIVISFMNGMNDIVIDRFLSTYPNINASAASFPDDFLNDVSSNELTNVLSKSNEETLLLLAWNKPSLVMMKGLELDKLQNSIPLFSPLDENSDSKCGLLYSVNPNKDFPKNGIIVGRNFLYNHQLTLGETLTFHSLHKSNFSSIGKRPFSKSFTLVGVYTNSIPEIEDNVIFTTYDDLLPFTSPSTENYNIYLNNNEDTNKLKSYLVKKYPEVNFEDWKDRNRNLFSAMQLEKLIMKVVLTLIIILSSFNLSGIFLKKVSHKKKELGILLTMGYTKREITYIFLLQGAYIGVLGILVGNILAFVLLTLQINFNIVPLPESLSGQFSSLPIKMEVTEFLSISAISLIVSLISSIIPTIEINRLNPIEIIKK